MNTTVFPDVLSRCAALYDRDEVDTHSLPQLVPARRYEDGMKNLLLALPLVFAFVASGLAYAHVTGNERRTVRQCNGLGAKNKRKACRACVTRKRPHHYHPKAAAGLRCNPNSGRP